ncbi:LexA family protein [Promicromonospora sp. MS192]|uniref:LexA family protein n=1 Tax=Promicromonospora sp. MS192 TaxID=3412684 RepID=UPI003C2D04DE
MFALSPRPASTGAISPTSTTALRIAPVSVPAGFPSPAQDYYDGPIDLTDMLVEDHAATFIVRAAGDSMTEVGISDGDELLVDRSKTPRDGDVVVAVLDGELTVKRLEVGPGGVVLRAESTSHPDIVVPELSDLQVWGVVTYCIHHLRGRR